LIASVGVLFLIACANLSNLFLARVGARRAEVATRLAVGAPRGRVLRLFLTESVVLACSEGWPACWSRHRPPARFWRGAAQASRSFRTPWTSG